VTKTGIVYAVVWYVQEGSGVKRKNLLVKKLGDGWLAAFIYFILTGHALFLSVPRSRSVVISYCQVSSIASSAAHVLDYESHLPRGTGKLLRRVTNASLLKGV
jgi:hypothetical protein